MTLIRDVRRRLGVSTLIVVEEAGRFLGPQFHVMAYRRRL